MLDKMLAVLFTSMLPIAELRGAIPLGISLGLSPELSALLGIAGNMAIVPILLFLINPLFHNFRKIDSLCKLINRYEAKAADRIKQYRKYRLWGLFLLVAIPIPTTGVYTGCVAATVLDIRFKAALGAISAGVLMAGLLVYLISSGVVGLVAT